MSKRGRARRSVKTGEVGETIARYALTARGFRMVEKIETGWKIVQWIERARGIARIVPIAKVSADWTAVVPDAGTRVLAEVKTYDRESFIWSLLKSYQHDRLAENESFGGISLVVWVRGSDAHIMRYGDLREAGFRKGRGIDVETARRLDDKVDVAKYVKESRR